MKTRRWTSSFEACCDEWSVEVGLGYTGLVLPNEQHQFVNSGPEVWLFLCAILLSASQTD